MGDLLGAAFWLDCQEQQDDHVRSAVPSQNLLSQTLYVATVHTMCSDSHFAVLSQSDCSVVAETLVSWPESYLLNVPTAVEYNVDFSVRPLLQRCHSDLSAYFSTAPNRQHRNRPEITVKYSVRAIQHTAHS